MLRGVSWGEGWHFREMNVKENVFVECQGESGDSVGVKVEVLGFGKAVRAEGRGEGREERNRDVILGWVWNGCGADMAGRLRWARVSSSWGIARDRLP